MPYIINVPAVPRPFITNDPAIYMDCLSWGWRCESRPFSDSYCKATRKREDSRFESERRALQLEQYWSEARERREIAKRSMSMANLGMIKSIKPFQGFGNRARNDSLISISVMELQESDAEDIELED
jgi:hypothetical protein